jgi:suppressor of fused-like protein
VGVTSEELSAAQQWNVQGILDLLKRKPLSGGEWLITNMRRGESLFDIDNDNQLLLMRGVEDEGSGLSGVSAVCSWEDGCGLKAAGSIITELPGMEGPPAVRGVAHCKGSEGGDMTIELLRTQTLKDVHLVFNLEAAKLIILALKGRLKHGRHFTFKSFSGDVAITFVSSGIEVCSITR